MHEGKTHPSAGSTLRCGTQTWNHSIRRKHLTRRRVVFYDTSSYREKLAGTRDDRTHGIVVLVPSESKRLIARGVLALPEVKRVLKEGLFVVSRGTTTGYIAEEILGVKLPK